MTFEWDTKKNQSNIEKHGVCFEEACEIFLHPHLNFNDHRFEYKETREISIGKIVEDIILVIVYTVRDKNIRIISARKANARERKKFDDYIKAQTR